MNDNYNDNADDNDGNCAARLMWVTLRSKSDVFPVMVNATDIVS